MTLKGFGGRVRQAWHRWASQNSEAVTYADFGAALAREEERAEPYSTSAISEWIAERSEPKARTYRAMAKITGLSDAWLMSGTLPEEGGDEGGQGAIATNGNLPPKPSDRPIVNRDIEKTVIDKGDPKSRPVRRTPGRTARAG